MSPRSIVVPLLTAVLAVACRQPPNESSPSSTAAPPTAASSVAPAAASPAAPTPSAPSTLSRVTEASKVCMVNDQFMDVEQIPVQVGAKTYFGCCAMCKEKLEKNEAARTAIDPVSGARVDKATAVIARDLANRVYYFESEQTMRRFTL